MNMSYCQFRNTLLDLYQCKGSWLDEDLSSDERESKEDMIKVMRQLISLEDAIADGIDSESAENALSLLRRDDCILVKKDGVWYAENSNGLRKPI